MYSAVHVEVSEYKSGEVETVMLVVAALLPVLSGLLPEILLHTTSSRRPTIEKIVFFMAVIILIVYFKQGFEFIFNSFIRCQIGVFNKDAKA